MIARGRHSNIAIRLLVMVSFAVGIACVAEPITSPASRRHDAVVLVHLVNATTPKNMAASLRAAASLSTRLGPRDRMLVMSGQPVGQHDVLLMDFRGDSIASAWERRQNEDEGCRVRPVREATIWATALITAIDEYPETADSLLLLRSIAELEIADEDLDHALSTFDPSRFQRVDVNDTKGDARNADYARSVLVIDMSALSREPYQLTGGGSSGSRTFFCYDQEKVPHGYDVIDSIAQLPRGELIDGFLRRVRPSQVVILASGLMSAGEAAWVNWLEQAFGADAGTRNGPAIKIVARNDAARHVYDHRQDRD